MDSFLQKSKAYGKWCLLEANEQYMYYINIRLFFQNN